MGSFLVPVLLLTKCLASPDSRTLLASNTELCSRRARVPVKGGGSCFTVSGPPSQVWGQLFVSGRRAHALGNSPGTPGPARLCFPPEGLRLVIEVYSLSGVVGRPDCGACV